LEDRNLTVVINFWQFGNTTAGY